MGNRFVVTRNIMKQFLSVKVEHGLDITLIQSVCLVSSKFQVKRLKSCENRLVG